MIIDWIYPGYYTKSAMDEVMQKLLEHDEKFDEHGKILAEHSKRFDEHDKRFDGIDQRLDGHDKRFDQIDKQIDFLAKKSLEHDEHFERIEANMATKADMQSISGTLDKLVKMYEKKDQENTLLAHGLKGVEDRVEVLEKDVSQIKPLLALS